jgi:DNA-3-methyladenine glycosylase II
MATARKVPAKKAATQRSAVKTAGRRRDAGASTAPREADDVAPALSAKAAKRPAASTTRASRALNGAAQPKPKATPARAAKANGAASPDTERDVQAFVTVKSPDDEHDEEVVRKTRASTGAQAATPVQVARLEPAVSRPSYWDRACADLVKRDRILKRLIPKFGPVHLVNGSDPFVTLARSVVGQQISVSSAQAVWGRVELACPKLAPQQFIKLGQDKLMSCGLSKRKSEYLLDLAQHFVSGALHVDKWMSMDDEAVIAELTHIRGIGRWTAEMFLIFNLSRPDVLPLDDLGLIRAISVNYFSGEPVTRSEAREVAANWEPWRTVATWYMWRSLDSSVED